MATIEFGTFKAPETVNPYIETIDEMIEYNTANPGEDCLVTITVHKDDALKTRTQFAKAANMRGFTARVRTNAAPIMTAKGNMTDEVMFQFTLTTKHKPRKGSNKGE